MLLALKLCRGRFDIIPQEKKIPISLILSQRHEAHKVKKYD